MGNALSNFTRNYSVYLALFFLYLAVYIFSGFFLHIYINSWTLVTAFASYSVLGAVYLIIRKVRTEKLILFIASLIITALSFWGLTTLFGRTYDISYDGQDYHQSAVIELSNRWNPIYQKQPPIKLTNAVDTPVISGYGKIVWSIDSSIYKLTGNIDSATAINLVVLLLSLTFVFYALRSLGIGRYLAWITAFLSAVTPLFVEQIFTFREDAISYEFFVIGVSSIILLLKSKHYFRYFMCLFTALIFLAGIKYSNLFIFLPLLVLSVYVILKYKMYKLRAFIIALAFGVIASFITLFNPYVTNVVWYKAIDYPFNQKSFSNDVRYHGTSLNIRNDGRFKLFYYGIFSAPDIGDAQSPSTNAHIKVPFSTSKSQILTEANTSTKLVGGYGVLFSGVFVISIGIYLYLVVRKKSKTEMRIFGSLSLVLVLIVASCLLNPVTNYYRYSSQLALFPVAIIIALLIMAGKKWQLEKTLAMALIVLLALNVVPDIIFASVNSFQNFGIINSQLSTLKSSNNTYLVYSGDFYSSYIKLRAHGVKIDVSQKPIHCSNSIILKSTYAGYPPTSTELCKLEK